MQATDHGEIWENRRSRGTISGLLNTVKLGTGTASESATDTGLDQKVYASDATQNDINVVESADGTQTLYQAEIQGGQNLPVDAEITEFGVFVCGTMPDGTAVDFGDLAQYTDEDGDLLHTRDTAPQVVATEGSRPTMGMTISWRRV